MSQISIRVDVTQRRAPGCRLRMVRRCLLLVELLRPLRRGATLDELWRDVSHDLGECCKRTIRRDLEALQLLGLVGRTGSVTRRFVWLGRPHGRPIEDASAMVAKNRYTPAGPSSDDTLAGCDESEYSVAEMAVQDA